MASSAAVLCAGWINQFIIPGLPRPQRKFATEPHRSIKLRLGPMLGFKRFRNASITIAGIELVHRIRKGQFALKRLRVRGKTAPEIWTAVLAA